MYVQGLFAEHRVDELFALIARYPVGAFTTLREQQLEIDHLPFSVHPSIGANGTLRCHVARGNPLWQAISDRPDVLIAFQSPSAYISPSWMPGRTKHGKVAPSWNYAAVHAYGVAQKHEDAVWLRQHLHDLIAPQETYRNEPWSLDEAPQAFVESLLPHIVGIEVTIDRLVGKWFVGQQRSPSDREGVVNGLLQEGTDAADCIAAMMQAYAPPVVPKD